MARSSIPGRVISNTYKLVLNVALFNTLYSEVCIKGSGVILYTSV